jgi:murein DD-endopeptidase MepM/ murein hydrolase activator NlpD
MRVLLSFVIGVLVGAGGLFAWLHQMPQAPAPQAVAQSAAVHTGSLPAPAGPDIESQLPPAPKVTPDLTELDLPLRPGVSDAAAPPANASPAPEVASGKLAMPVEGVNFSQITDNFDQARGSERHHEALDIMAPRGAKVFAVSDGKLVKLFTSKPGGLTAYQFDPSEKFAYYYAHLDHYADGLKEGAALHKGDLIGYVGSTGNADAKAPHLHFAVFELTPEKQWWKGTPVDPYPLLKP